MENVSQPNFRSVYIGAMISLDYKWTLYNVDEVRIKYMTSLSRNNCLRLE